MDAVTLSTVCILCAAQPSPAPAPIAQWAPIIAEASARFAVPQAWIRRVIQSESGGWTTQNGKPITSSAGAMGLMQIMPGTYAGLRRRYSFGPDPYDPHDNILAGTAYLHEMHERYGYPFLFAAYHAGPRRFENFINHGRAMPPETLRYANGLVSKGLAALRSAAARQTWRMRYAAVFPVNDFIAPISGTSNALRTFAAGTSAQRAYVVNSVFATARTGADPPAHTPYSHRETAAMIAALGKRTLLATSAGRLPPRSSSS